MGMVGDDLQEIIEGSFLSAEFAVFDTNPYEAAYLGDKPDQEAKPRATHLGPALLIHETTVGYDHWDGNGCWCGLMGGAVKRYRGDLRVMRDERARVRTLKWRAR